MAGFFFSDRPEALENNPRAEAGKMAEYRKGSDEKQKEPSDVKAGKEEGMLPAKKHFKETGKKDGKKHSRKSSRR